MSPERGGSRDSTRELPVQAGAIHGAAAYVVGYVLTGTLAAVGTAPDARGYVPCGLWSSSDEIGWLFYASHFADPTLSTTPAASCPLPDGPVSVLPTASTQFPTVAVYYLVPVVVLAAASYLLVGMRGVDNLDAEVAAKTGATVVAGYLPLAAVGTVAFEDSFHAATIQGREVIYTVGPDLVAAVLLAGIAYPLVFGALGGWLRVRTRSG